MTGFAVRLSFTCILLSDIAYNKILIIFFMQNYSHLKRSKCDFLILTDSDYVDVPYFPESKSCLCLGTLDGKVDSPKQSGSLHSSCGRRAAQLCRCETPPVQWTKHCCHPVDRREEEREREKPKQR